MRPGRRRWAALLAGAAAAAPAAAQDVEDLLDELTRDVELMEQQDAGLDDLLSDDGLDELLGGIDEPAPDAAADSPLTDWKGFVELRPRAYLRDHDDTDKNDAELFLEAELELDFRFGERLTGYFRPRVFVDALNGDSNRFEPYEAYLTWQESSWDLRAGQFVENWGIVDTFNPIDVVNRRDFATDFLDPDRLGELGVRYRRFFDGGDTIGEPTLSLYALPTWRETRFPGEDSRFSFDQPGMPFVEEDGLEPSGSERGLYAARFQSTLTTGPANADLQLLVARGPERGPLAVPDPGAAAPQLVPAYYGARTFGAGLRAVPNEDVLGHFLATLTLKAEVVFKDPYRFDGSPIETPEDYLAYVVGVDRLFYDLLRAQDQLTVTLEYAGETGADDAATVFRPFRNDVIARAFWEANDFARRSLELRTIYDVDTKEVIWESIFETQLRAIHEDLKLNVQLQLFDPPGNGESVFDFFPNNSLLAIGLRWDL
ncbi:MAG: hypothetical protein AAF682_01410 [Planctomycetota bacterium]